MKKYSTSVIFVIVGVVSLIASLIIVTVGVFSNIQFITRFGLLLSILAIVLFVYSMFQYIREYSATRPVSSGYPNYRYFALKRRTKHDLETFLMYDDLDTAFGIKRDFYNQSKLLGIDENRYQGDYQDILAKVRNIK